MIAPVPSCRQVCASAITSARCVGGKTAAAVTDEDHDRLVGFLHRDRMAQAIIVGDAGGRHLVAGVRAGAERDGKAEQRCLPCGSARLRSTGVLVVIVLVLVPPQSVMKP